MQKEANGRRLAATSAQEWTEVLIQLNVQDNQFVKKVGSRSGER
jgi:hypothetical protein